MNADIDCSTDVKMEKLCDGIWISQMKGPYSFIYSLLQSLIIILIEYLPGGRHSDKGQEVMKWVGRILQS